MSKYGFSAGKYIYINTLLKTLKFYQGSHLVKTFSIAVGKSSTPTPTGQYKIISKIVNPGNSLGSKWLGLSISTGHYGIHGTNAPSSIGRAVTNGCIRLKNEQIDQLFPLVNISTPVFIVAEQEKNNNLDYQSEENLKNNDSKDNEESEELQQEEFSESSDNHLNQWGFYYRVIPGDTLWTVARRFGLPVQLLIEQNSLEDPNKIYPGQKLFIPRGRMMVK
jgi:hypothetical protein